MYLLRREESQVKSVKNRQTSDKNLHGLNIFTEYFITELLYSSLL